MFYPSFKYCPFCGEHIPQQNIVKFCSFCGGKLLFIDNKSQKIQSDENIIFQDKLRLEHMIKIHDEHPEINIDGYNKVNLDKFIQSEYYSIILKDVSNKQRLIQKLEKVLLRGSFAIQLAVDNIPSIIIYKTKGYDIPFLNKIFIEEHASVSIVPGDFNTKPDVEEVFNGFDRFSIKTQKIIKSLPINLWLGDIICGIFPNNYKENNEGIVVITDKNIYFIPNEIYINTNRWFVRSYSLLSKVIIQDNCLLLIDKGMNVTSIAFADQQKLADAYQCINHIVQRCK
ncbi:MAG: hypothetical protein H6Q68_3307 [Firmicutes bacterium]|nr:hypothetical protein [Bacillota bacterium]